MAPRKSKTVADAWQGFYASPHGRMAIAEFLVACNVYNPIDAESEIEAHRLEGERRAALRIISYIGMRPADFTRAAIDDSDIVERLIRETV